MNKKNHLLLLSTILIIIGSILFSAVNPVKLAFASPTLSKSTFFEAKVNATNLNVRKGPSTSSGLVCVLKTGDIVTAYGQVGTWSIIYHSGKKCVGMVFSKYLTPINVSTPKPSTTKPPIISKPSTKPSSKPIPPSSTKSSNVTKSPTTAKTPVPTNIIPTTEENDLLNLINKARKNAGIGLLQFDLNVLKTSRLKARDMVEKNYFSHQSPTYGSPFDMMRQFGIIFKSAGENIAGNSTITGAYNAWMKSEGHKKNIMNGSFNYTGIGIEQSSVYGKILVQQFIGR